MVTIQFPLPSLHWVEYMPVLQTACNVRLDANQLQRACTLAQRVHDAVPDPTPTEILAALRTDASLREFAAALENSLRR